MAEIDTKQQTHEDGVPTQRRKLHLKPRDPEAAARIEAERAQSLGKSPFGAAKPREVVIAHRVGKTEEDVLKEEVRKEKIHLRLNPSQIEEKKSHEAAVKEIEDQIAAEADEKKRDLLQVELAARQSKLDALMDRFVQLTLENAKSGEAPRVSQMKKVQSDAGHGHHHHHSNPRYNPTQQQYSGSHRGGHRGGGYGGRYVPAHGRGGRAGGRYNSNNNASVPAVPDWAKEEYSGGNSQHQVGGLDSDGTFYDYPGQTGGYGRGRGRGRGYRPPQEQPPSSYYQGPYPGRGVGGEIEFDTFSGQDRY